MSYTNRELNNQRPSMLLDGVDSAGRRRYRVPVLSDPTPHIYLNIVGDDVLPCFSLLLSTFRQGSPGGQEVGDDGRRLVIMDGQHQVVDTRRQQRPPWQVHLMDPKLNLSMEKTVQSKVVRWVHFLHRHFYKRRALLGASMLSKARRRIR